MSQSLELSELEFDIDPSQVYANMAHVGQLHSNCI